MTADTAILMASATRNMKYNEWLAPAIHVATRFRFLGSEPATACISMDNACKSSRQALLVAQTLHRIHAGGALRGRYAENDADHTTNQKRNQG